MLLSCKAEYEGIHAKGCDIVRMPQEALKAQRLLHLPHLNFLHDIQTPLLVLSYKESPTFNYAMNALTRANAVRQTGA